MLADLRKRHAEAIQLPNPHLSQSCRMVARRFRREAPSRLGDTKAEERFTPPLVFPLGNFAKTKGDAMSTYITHFNVHEIHVRRVENSSDHLVIEFIGKTENAFPRHPFTDVFTQNNCRSSLSEAASQRMRRKRWRHDPTPSIDAPQSHLSALPRV